MTINILQNSPNGVQVNPLPSQLTGGKNNIFMYLKTFQVGAPAEGQLKLTQRKGNLPRHQPSFSPLAEFSIVFPHNTCNLEIFVRKICGELSLLISWKVCMFISPLEEQTRVPFCIAAWAWPDCSPTSAEVCSHYVLLTLLFIWESFSTCCIHWQQTGNINLLLFTR